MLVYFCSQLCVDLMDVWREGGGRVKKDWAAGESCSRVCACAAVACWPTNNWPLVASCWNRCVFQSLDASSTWPGHKSASPPSSIPCPGILRAACHLQNFWVFASWHSDWDNSAKIIKLQETQEQRPTTVRWRCYDNSIVFILTKAVPKCMS